MSLQAAFRSAKSALATNAFQTAVLARNVSSADAKGYARRVVLIEPALTGAGSAMRVARATDFALQRAALDAGASAQGAAVISKALDDLQYVVGDPTNGASPSARISALKIALLQAAAAPQDAAGLASAVSAAKSLASALSDATARVQNVRLQADQDMVASVANINSLLKSFETTNAAIVSGQSKGQDVSDALDRRDGILEELAKELSISTVAGPNGDLSIYTDSGVALFQGAPRFVSIEPTTMLTAGVAGNAVYVDGVAVTGPTATMPLREGALSGFAEIRDNRATAYQSQLDEVAVGLISAFSQSPNSVSAGAPRTGLFTWSGGPALPSSGAAGMAAEIRVDPSVVSDPSLLRDGGIGDDPAYVTNMTGSPNFSSRLYALVDALGAPQTFAAPGLPSKLSVIDLATQSDAWLEGARQSAAELSANADAIMTQSSAALSNSVGVNIDDQMSRMLDLENSYQASAKLMATIDSMYAALFSAVQSATA